MLVSRSIAIAMGLLVLSSCSVYRVKVLPSKDENKPGGIPFYTMKPVCERKTPYLQPIYTVVVTKPSKDEEKPPTVVLTRNLSLHQRTSHSKKGKPPACGDQLNLLLAGVVSDKQPEGKILDQCSEVEPPSTSPSTSFPDGDDLLLAGNTASFTSIIDAEHRYVFNVKQPIAGSSTGDISLGPDGTLQKATATVNDQTLQTLVSGLTAVTGAATQIMKGVAAPERRGYYGASVSTTTYIWTAARYVPAATSIEPAQDSEKTCTPGDLIPLGLKVRTTRQLETAPESLKTQDTGQQKKP